ncbi:MAG: oligosaccharide flippase family protein [Bacillaceae bacterium]
MKNSLFVGTLILTISMFLSKVLGFIYVIPFTHMVGTQGYILFEYAYKPYVIMLSLATMGIPMAVSKFVSKYQEMGDYKTVDKMMRSGTIILLLTGTLFASLLFITSPGIARLLIDETQNNGNSLADVIYVIKTVSLALLIVPVMAIFRGYFQGNQKMTPTAISQVIEQLLRIGVILFAAFFIMVLGSKNIKLTIGIATIGTTIGAIGSCLVLWYYWRKYKGEFTTKRKHHEKRYLPAKSYKEIYKELSASAIPFVLVSLTVPIFQNIDMFLINPVLISQGSTLGDAEYVNSIVALVQKIATIPTIFANAFAITLVPAITQSFIHGDIDAVKSKVTQTMQIILYLTLPIGAYFALCGQSFFAVLLGTEHMEYGGIVTQSNAVLTVIMSLYFISTAILQGMDKQKLVVIGLAASIIVKFVVSIPLIRQFGGVGTSYSSTIGYAVAIAINLYAVKKVSNIKISEMFKRSGLFIIITAISALAMFITHTLTVNYLVSSLPVYVQQLIIASLTGLVGMVIYFGLSLKLNVIPTEILKKVTVRFARGTN